LTPSNVPSLQRSNNASLTQTVSEEKHGYHLDDVLKEWNGKNIDNAECARLVQVLCPDVGWTGRWQRGPRVIDVLPHLLPGTVVANFKYEGGRWKFPNKKGWHSGLYKQNGRGRVMPNGLPCVFTIVNQWPGQHVEERGLPRVTPAMIQRNPLFAGEANNADDFYVVLVP
jgi:hypothetical protein